MLCIRRCPTPFSTDSCFTWRVAMFCTKSVQCYMHRNSCPSLSMPIPASSGELLGFGVLIYDVECSIYKQPPVPLSAVPCMPWRVLKFCSFGVQFSAHKRCPSLSVPIQSYRGELLGFALRECHAICEETSAPPSQC